MEGFLPAARSCVAHAGVGPGDEVLDIALIAGGAAGRAAEEAGASVTSVADPDALSFGDESFDVALSAFGCMYARDHHALAEEIARVLRPGGRMCLCAWSPDGPTGDLFRTVAGHLPPARTSPPELWGSADHVRRLFEPTAVAVRSEREAVEVVFDSVDDAIAGYAAVFGPIVPGTVEPQERRRLLEVDLRTFFERAVTPDDEVRIEAEYLVATGRKG